MDKKEKKNIKGIRIRTMNYGMILAACILYVMVIFVTIHISVGYQNLSDAMDHYIECMKAADQVTEGSDYLTMKVRLYVETEDLQQVKDYFEELHVTKRRDKAVEELEHHQDNPEAHRYLELALEKSNELMQREFYAMRLVAEAAGQGGEELPQEVRDVTLSAKDLQLSPEEMQEKAREMVFGTAYQDAKALIGSNIAYFFTNAVETTRLDQVQSALILEKSMVRQRVYISILFVLNIVTFVMVIMLIVKPLQIYIRCIKEDKMLEIAGAYEFKYLALTYNDIYEVNAANEAMLRHKAEHDPLTGVINRGGFDQLSQILKAQKIPLALLLIDVDKFKQVNDGYGHETGDLVLKKVAKLLRESFRSNDYVARLGGDEFAVLMVEATPEQEVRIRNKVNYINSVLKNPEDGLPEVSLSVGVAFSAEGFTDDLYRNTDSALYLVKEHGRCGCDFYRG
ncbi:GGDEF domain-containing protein [Clostridiaceae bacterium]|nr:GGDEF domain-containing protein [Clostridiaceae bacterium]RKI09054.1 GGDEF domain-containing protein [bacterium 1XD21-70]